MTPAPLADISACVFDAYGTLFDVNAAAEARADRLGDGWKTLSKHLPPVYAVRFVG